MDITLDFQSTNAVTIGSKGIMKEFHRQVSLLVYKTVKEARGQI
jgi:hypothetical protein